MQVLAVEKVNINVRVSKYTSRVLGVIKEKFDLHDKSEALDKFADMFGEKFVEREVKDEVVLDAIRSAEQHAKKYGSRKMSLGELRRLCGVDK